MCYRLLLFFLLFSCELFAKTTLCLNMIVKDEEKVIERCLASVKPYIDYWVIVDTGSSDKTKEVIRHFLKDIPGELHERPWKNFGYNRTEAFQLAKGKADYTLLIDADDYLEFDPKVIENGKSPFANLTQDSYHMWRGSKDFAYLIPQVIKTEVPWRWVGVTHEYLASDRPHTQETLTSVRYISGGGGARSNGIQKFLKNVELLEEGLKEEPNNVRYMFYLGESYRDAGMPEKALVAYEKRVAMGGWDEEVYCSLFQIAKMKERLNAPWEEIAAAYYRAHFFRQHRPEPVYNLARLYNQQSKCSLAYETIKGWQAVPKPQTKDVLFNETWSERWGIPFEFSIAAYYVGDHQGSVDACNLLLAMGDEIPSYIRDRTIANRVFPLQHLYAFKEEAPVVNVQGPVPEKKPIVLKEKKYPKGKRVLLAILAKDKAHVLPYFLRSIDQLDYDKRLITVYINTNNNSDATKEILESWAEKNRNKYHAIDFETHEISNLQSTNPHVWTTERFHVLGSIRNKSLTKTKEHHCDFYLVIDCDNFVAPFTLKDLVAKDLPIVAPMLHAIPLPYDHYTNYFCGVDENGYYRHDPMFFPILHRQKVGTFEVPLVHMTYLIKAEYIDQLTYIDGSPHHECIIFSRSARNHHVPQYICNEKEFGVFLHFDDLSSKVTLDDEKNYFNHYIKMQKRFTDLKI